MAEPAHQRYAAKADDPREKALVAALQRGEPEAYEELLSRYEGKIYQLAFRFTRNAADAEEVVQNVFLQVFRKVTDFQGGAAFSSWLYRVTSNAALMLLRKRKNKPDSLEDVLPNVAEQGLPNQDEAPWSHLPEERYLAQEALARVDEAIEKLPPDYRVVFVLRDVEGQTNEEVASMLELSVPAVKSRLHRARLFLRNDLGAYFGKQAAS